MPLIDTAVRSRDTHRPEKHHAGPSDRGEQVGRVAFIAQVRHGIEVNRVDFVPVVFNLEQGHEMPVGCARMHTHEILRSRPAHRHRRQQPFDGAFCQKVLREPQLCEVEGIVARRVQSNLGFICSSLIARVLPQNGISSSRSRPQVGVAGSIAGTVPSSVLRHSTT